MDESQINGDDVKRIAEQICQGYTSGLFNRGEYRITWQINEEKDLIVKIFKY